VNEIVMVSDHFNLPGDTIPIGGVQKHISAVSDELKRRGHSVKWMYPASAVGRAVELSRSNVFFHDWSAFRNFPSVTRTIIFHGWEGVCPPNPKTVAARQHIHAQCDYSMCVGHYVEKHYGTKCDHVIYGGANLPEGFERRPVGDEFNVLFLGRVARDTEPALAVYAFSQFVSTNARFFEQRGCATVRLALAGDGDQRARIELQALELTRRFSNVKVECRGFVADIWPLVSTADLVIPTGYLSAAEAMAANVPSVVFIDERYTPTIKRDYWAMMPNKLKPAVVSTHDSERFLTEGFDAKFNGGEYPKAIVPGKTPDGWPSIADAYISCLAKK